MGRIILSGFADEYDASIDKQLEVLCQNDFEKLELRFADGVNVSDLTDEHVSEIKSKLEKTGITLSALGSPLGKISLEDDLAAHLEKAKRTFSIAEKLNTKNIRMFSFYIPKGKTRDDCRAQVMDWVGALLDTASNFDVVLCHENEAGIYGESPERCLDLFNEFGGKLKCVFDAGNFVLDNYETYPHAYNLLKDHIEYFHIKDSFSTGAIVPPGKGEAKLGEILKAYRSEYERDVIITLEPHLLTFDNLSSLTDKTFDNPYKYENQQVAFLDAIKKLNEIL
ncbi:MAG: sugar phosphate isomerase/epimerase [Ruminococcaceae bacterium]|nr:sugar phosphate isomerase/epimerase [Oscillospiraceae bacterium]